MRKATDTSMRRGQDSSRRPCCRCSNAPHGQSPWPQRPTGQTQDRFASTSVRGCAACGGEGAALCALCIHCSRVRRRSSRAVGAAQPGAVSVPCVGSPSPPGRMIPRTASTWTRVLCLWAGSSVTRSADAFERENIHISPVMARSQSASVGILPQPPKHVFGSGHVCHRSSRSRCRRHVPPRIRPARDGAARGVEVSRSPDGTVPGKRHHFVHQCAIHSPAVGQPDPGSAWMATVPSATT
jgi:hypothetical protein